MAKYVDFTKKKTRIWTGVLVMLAYVAIILGYGCYQLNNIKSVPTKNEPIGGMYDVMLGANFLNITSEQLTAIEKYQEIDLKYDMLTAQVKGTDSKLTVFAMKNNHQIYQIIYKTYTEDCDIAEQSILKLRSQYGIGDYNVLDAALHMNNINKGNKTITVTCETGFFDHNRSVKVIYTDKELESQLDKDYQAYKSKQIDKNLKLN